MSEYDFKKAYKGKDRDKSPLVDIILGRKAEREESDDDAREDHDEADESTDDGCDDMAREMMDCFHAKDHEGLASVLRMLKGK